MTSRNHPLKGHVAEIHDPTRFSATGVETQNQPPDEAYVQKIVEEGTHLESLFDQEEEEGEQDDY